jgi:hypothetical protein
VLVGCAAPEAAVHGGRRAARGRMTDSRGAEQQNCRHDA